MNRRPSLRELYIQKRREQERQERRKAILKAASDKWFEDNKEWFETHKGNAKATPSPDEMPADYNDGKGGNDENS